ncbi:cobyrinate a,c-diamide synthase [Xylanibacillus composti]|uniref:Cobyrinate a,c-diamide synthase n=1 Tax=Xylanibacillus composti TaxID=1572762 RepID=A0A8J4H678_9BACL|nr:cobyrinate a,c-diamide synthase [Xylanibacillus composti]GIQ69579.1 cobyrinate a,c-diamide synthase [Xylanibacillus composti]
MKRRLVIAGTGSGVGKTTLTIGLMAAWRRRGLAVQGFKCGPDYIDPSYHRAVTGRPSRNLDSWMLSPEAVREIMAKGSQDADISVIEGVMGFYDGKSPESNAGSTAEISLITESPVLLAVNCSSMARSAAAIVKGFQSLDPKVRIVGVFANQVGSEGHFQLVKRAIEQECGIPVIGYLRKEEAIEIPERHLGLIPSLERGELAPLFGQLADLIEAHVDLDQVFALSEASELAAEPVLFRGSPSRPRIQIAVARDAAFHFYYPENLELLEWHGARLLYFSPLAGESVPAEADGLYIGGGFPEEFAPVLASQKSGIRSMKDAITRGLPTLAECGGYMVLSESIQTTDGVVYPMAGLVAGRVVMQDKLAALGYRDVRGTSFNFLLPDGETAKGHEFHYSVMLQDAERASDSDKQGDPIAGAAYETAGRFGMKREGFAFANLCAGYTHLHFGSNPEIVRRWIRLCELAREERNHS